MEIVRCRQENADVWNGVELGPPDANSITIDVEGPRNAGEPLTNGSFVKHSRRISDFKRDVKKDSLAIFPDGH